MKTLRIEVTFPVAVDLPDDFQKRLAELLGEVCKAYEAANPARVMWCFGVGSKITYMPMTADEETTRGLEYDNDTLHFEIAERERYHKWFVPSGFTFECCKACGMVRQRDGSNDTKPCRGSVAIGMRTLTERSPAATNAKEPKV